MDGLLNSFLPALPKGDALFLFLVCLLIGAFVVFMYCLDQFDKPSVTQDENDPWKFVPPRNLTPSRQYLFGFAIYCGALFLIFLAISLLGPERILLIVKGTGHQGSELEAALGSFSTFPIVVAFIIVSLHPSLHLPKSLDIELFIRRFSHRMAYIPKHMGLIFNHMRFSDYDLSQDKIDDGWNAIGLPRPTLDAPDLSSIRPLLDRTVLLYVRALSLATEGRVEDGQQLMQDLSVDVFRQYRAQIESIEVSIQAAHARLSELDGISGHERRRAVLLAQRELIKSLEFLYVVFACAITGRGMGRISKRLKSLGFASDFAPDPGIPWDPILKTLGAAAVVLAAAWLIAANTFHGAVQGMNIPTDTVMVLRLLVIILIVHLVAILEALRLRTRLIGLDKYFSETGKAHAVAFVRIFARCAVACLACYLVLNINSLVGALTTPVLDPSKPGNLTSAEIAWDYLRTYLVWSIVPACCGVMVAFTIERSVDSRWERLTSGLLQGGVMAAAALLAVELTTGNQAPFGFRIFTVVLYGGLGLVLGFMLPAAIRRHWAALENRLPDKIAVLRTNVLQYFHNSQQFTEWLNMRNERLKGRRPLDVLAEEAGLQQLTSMVAETRTKISPVLA